MASAAIGNLMCVPWCLEGLACVAAARGDYAYAAELDGARERLCAQTGSRIPPVHPAAYARMVDSVRAAIGPIAFGAAQRQSADKTPQEIVAAYVAAGDVPPVSAG
jgi:hypothetical protein